MKSVILYHQADLDGVLSGVIAKYYLSLRHETVEAIGSDYHLPINIEALDKFDNIYVIDFSNKELFESKLAKKIIWIDHHASAIEEFRPLKLNQFCIDGVAACRLAFQFFTNINYSMLDKEDFFARKVQEPFVITLAGEFDIWDLTSPCARPFNFGIADLSFSNIDILFKSTKSILCPGPRKNRDESYLEELIEKLASIDGREPKRIYNAIQRGKGVVDYINSTSYRVPPNFVIIDGKRGRVFNTHVFSSLVHTNTENEDFIMVWSHLGGNKVKVSFYSEKINCFELAKKFGGGGHKGAAGCTIDLFTLGNILFTK